MAKKTIPMYTDPGHGWGKVKRSDLRELGILGKITQYSYQRGEFVYLEEDKDISTYISALRDRGIEVRITEKSHAKSTSRIRNYESFFLTKGEQDEARVIFDKEFGTEFVARYITSAPEVYDYWYTTSVKVLGAYNNKRIRLVQHNDENRFMNYQIPRYNSGLYFCYHEDSENAKYILSKLGDRT